MYLDKDEEDGKALLKNPNNDDEIKLLTAIDKDRLNVEAMRTSGNNDIADQETIWEDEYYMRKGGGLQWSTSFAYRSQMSRQIRPNSEDNFVFNSTEQIKANVTASTPVVSVEGIEEQDKDIAEKITYMSRFNDERNKFNTSWKKIVHEFVNYGPAIASVEWDPVWSGGYGERRWIGDVRITRVPKEEFYPDPAISDLDERLQDCSFIIRKPRIKLAAIKNRWSERGKYVATENHTNDMVYEGSDPKQVYLVMYYHKGKPRYMPKERAKELRDKSEQSIQEGDYYKSKDYADMSLGDMDGIHCAYVANGVVLEYVPYVREDNLYPFAFKTCYYDEYNQLGFGEIRNIKIPQVNHNKADEIELEAMSRQGLGGSYYEEGSVSPGQLDVIKKNSGKGGVWLAVKNIFKIKEREPVKVPATLLQYKEHKQRMIETISQVTPIQQGMSPGANMPYRAIAELGNRTDIRMKQKVDVLEDFLIEINKLRIPLFAQYYDEDRYYRVKGSDGQIYSGTLNKNEMMFEWERELIRDDMGNVIEERKEKFVPEFDIKVTIIDEKPKDRNYYTQTAFNLLTAGAMTIEDLWYTLEEGKFPAKDDVLKNLQAQNSAMQIIEMMKTMTPERQMQIMQTIQQVSQIDQQKGSGEIG